LNRLVGVQVAVVTRFFLEQEQQLTTLVGGTNCVEEVMKLSYNSLESEDLISFSWGRCCKLGFEPAHAFAVQGRLDDEVYDMFSTAYTVA
jgi:hypothetical protein